MFRKSYSSFAIAFPLLALLGCGGVDNVGESPDAVDEPEAAEATAENPLLAADADGNGLISKTEFLTKHAARFDAADADHDGSVAGAELAALHPAAGRPEHHKKGFRGHGPEGKGPPDGKMDPEARFAAADANADGTLVKAEVEAQAASKFAELDANGDGVLSEDERPFKHGPMKIEGNVDKATFVAKAWERLSKADANADGQLTKEELRAAGPMMGRGKGGPMGQIDTDGNGAISKAEFAAMGEKMWSHLDADQSGSLEPAEVARAKRPRGMRPVER